MIGADCSTTCIHSQIRLLYKRQAAKIWHEKFDSKVHQNVTKEEDNRAKQMIKQQHPVKFSNLQV